MLCLTPLLLLNHLELKPLIKQEKGDETQNLITDIRDDGKLNLVIMMRIASQDNLLKAFLRSSLCRIRGENIKVD